MLVTCSLEANGDQTATLVEAGERNAQDSVPARAIFPITDSLSGAPKKRENAFVTPRTRCLDELLSRGGLKVRGNPPRHPSSELGGSATGRRITACHSVTAASDLC